MPRIAKQKVPKVRIVPVPDRTPQLRYVDPETGEQKRISTGTHDAVKLAQKKRELEAKLLLGIDPTPRKRSEGGADMSWSDFRERYSRNYLATLKSMDDANWRLNVIERIAKPKTLGDIAIADVAYLVQAELLAGAESVNGRPRSPHTVKSYMAAYSAAMNWAAEMGWIPSPPKIRKVRTAKLRHMKGRPITGEEFERMLMVTQSVVGVAADPSWQFLLRGLWESGLRIDELMHVSWDDPTCIMPAWQRGALPVLVIPHAMQKNATEESIPLLEGFERLLLEVDETNRRGWVFNPASLQTKKGRQPSGERPTAEWVGKIISRIGEKAGVVVATAQGMPGTIEHKPAKYASAHDLRRSLADRMAAAGVPERDLAAIMRHASVETTRRHYAPLNVQRSAGVVRQMMAAADATVPKKVGYGSASVAAETQKVS